MQDRAIRTYVDRSDVLDLTETLPVYQPLCKGIEGQRTPHQRRELFRETMCRHRMKMAVFVEHQVPDCRTAKAVRLVENCIEHRRKIAGRRVDDRQHLRSRGLLFQRLARGNDQPRVLHRDDRLSSEVL